MADNELKIRITVQDAQAQERLIRLSLKIKQMGQDITSMGRDLTMGVTVPIIGAFAATIAASKDLQEALKPIKDEFAGIAKELGDSLVVVIKEMMPDIKLVIGYVADLVHKFAELDTDSKKRILGFIAAIAALGPALMVTGQIISFVASLQGIGAVLGMGGTAAGGVGALATGGGVTAAIGGFGAALTGVILPLVAVIGLAIILYKWLDKLGAIDAAGKAIKDLGGIIRYGIGTAGGLGKNPGELSAYVTGGMQGLNNYGSGTGYSLPPAPTNPNTRYYRGGQLMQGGMVVNVNAPNVVGTKTELAAALKPALEMVLRQYNLLGQK